MRFLPFIGGHTFALGQASLKPFRGLARICRSTSPISIKDPYTKHGFGVVRHCCLLKQLE